MVKISGDIDQGQPMKYTIFYCVHCLDEKNHITSYSGTFDEVSGHWLTAHLDESIDKPFQFYAVALAKCFYCPTFGTYHDLVNHHRENHANSLFVISDRINPMKCGVCAFKGSDLAEHFRVKHELSSTPKVFNPINYSEEQIDDLLSINVTKKHQCGECHQLFETQDEIGQHIHYSHFGQAVRSKQIIVNQNIPHHLICGYCNKNIDSKRYLGHLSEHTFNFRCTMCSHQSGDLSEIAFHEKIIHGIDSLNYHCSIFPVWMKKKLFNTNMVFDSGLVLKAYNVLNTKLDDSKYLDLFIQGFLDVNKEKAQQLIGNQQRQTILNRSIDRSVRYSMMYSDSNKGPSDTNRNVPLLSANLMAAASSCLAPPIATDSSDIVNEQFNQLKTLVEGLVQTQVETGKSNQLHRQAFQIDSVSMDERSLMGELSDQRKLVKNIYVQGICQNIGGTDRYGIFLKLCKKMGVTVSRNDIQRIDQCSKGITVKLHRIEVKKMIMNQIRDKFLWTNELFKIPKGKNPWKVRVCEHMTNFYSKMWFTAFDLKEQHRLHSFKLTEDGLVVKAKAGCSERIVLSEQQLLEYIQQF